MTYIEWGPDLEIGLPEIDDQHRTLVKLANRLYEELKRGTDGDSSKNAVAELFAYSATHFADEEAYFSRYNFASLEQHKLRHAEFLARALDFEERLSAGNPAETDEILVFLKEWIVKHIGREDRELARIARMAKF